LVRKANGVEGGNTSSYYALQLWESFGLLNDDLPFGAILDMFCPLNSLHPSHVIPDVIFPSGLGLPVCGFHLYIFFTTLVSGILFMCPNQLSLWDLTLCWFNLHPYCLGRKAAFFSVGIKCT
jgi:hypothetical protein